MFSHDIDFNRHVAKVHERNKPFDCKLCDKKFSHNSDINRHVASVHQGNKPFQCNLCCVPSVHEVKIPNLI